MDNIWPLIWVTAIAGMGGTGLGGVVACLFRKESDKAVSLLLSFAAGVMTAVVCFDLLTEALNTGDRVHLWLVASGVLFGYTIISVMNRWIDRATNHEEAQAEVLHAKAPDSLDELTHADNLNARTHWMS